MIAEKTQNAQNKIPALQSASTAISIILSSEINLNFNLNASEPPKWLKRLAADAQNDSKARNRDSATSVPNLAAEMSLFPLSSPILPVLNENT